MYFEAGTLTQGQNNCFRLESCNMFNCTAQYVELDANLKGMLYFFLKFMGGARLILLFFKKEQILSTVKHFIRNRKTKQIFKDG